MIIELNDGTFTSDGTGLDSDIATWNGKEVWFHFAGFLDLLNPVGAGLILLPDQASAHPLPAGWNCLVHTASPLNAGAGSGCIQVKPTGVAWIGDFWSASHKYGRFLNLTSDFARISYNGNDEYAIANLSPHRGEERSQRSLTTSAYSYCPIGPVDENETIVVDASACGGNVMLEIEPLSVWCPPSRVTGGHYPQYKFSVMKVDSAAGGKVGIRTVTSLRGPDGPPIFGSNDPAVTGLNRGYYYLTQQGDTAQFVVAPDKVRVVKNNRFSFATS